MSETGYADGAAGEAVEAVSALAEDAAAVVPEPPERTPILWHSNAPWVGTGYGTQSALFGPLLAEKLGYHVAFSAFYGLKGSRLAWASTNGHPYVVYPSGRDAYSNDVLGAHAKHWFKGRGGLVILLTDPWVQSAGIIARLPTLAWCPVDHDPLIQVTKDWFNKSGAIPIAMSMFGEQKLIEAGLKPLYVPHGFDPAVFHPADKAAARKALGLPADAFIVSMVAANHGTPSRKSFGEAIMAFAEFARDKTDVVLYLHTRVEEQDGVDLTVLCEFAGVRPYVADQYGMALGHPASAVALVHQAADVLLNPARGEGFGVPLIEAQACGTPCIVTNYSAMPEVAPDYAGNWWVDGQQVWTHFDSLQIVPNIEEIKVCLQAAYDEPEADRQDRRVRVFNHAYENYKADHVTENFWKPVLLAAADEIAWRTQKMTTYS